MKQQSIVGLAKTVYDGIPLSAGMYANDEKLLAAGTMVFYFFIDHVIKDNYMDELKLYDCIKRLEDQRNIGDFIEYLHHLEQFYFSKCNTQKDIIMRHINQLNVYTKAWFTPNTSTIIETYKVLYANKHLLKNSKDFANLMEAFIHLHESFYESHHNHNNDKLNQLINGILSPYNVQNVLMTEYNLGRLNNIVFKDTNISIVGLEQDKMKFIFDLLLQCIVLHHNEQLSISIRNENIFDFDQSAVQSFDAMILSKISDINISLSDSYKYFNSDKDVAYDKADLANIQYALQHLAQEGIMIAFPNPGALYRLGIEEEIRRVFIEEQNVLDAVILLPGKVFKYGIHVMMIFKKNRKISDDILFIDASKLYEKNIAKLTINASSVFKIVETYMERKNLYDFSYEASRDEILQNEYNLNVSRYVEKKYKSTEYDEVRERLLWLDREILKKEVRISKLMKKLDVNYRKDAPPL